MSSEDCVKLACELAHRSGLDHPTVTSLQDINAYFLCTLFQKIFGKAIQGLKLPMNVPGRICENLHLLMKAIMKEIPITNLEHIKIVDILQYNPITIYNLLELLQMYLDMNSCYWFDPSDQGNLVNYEASNSLLSSFLQKDKKLNVNSSGLSQNRLPSPHSVLQCVSSDSFNFKVGKKSKEKIPETSENEDVDQPSRKKSVELDSPAPMTISSNSSDSPPSRKLLSIINQIISNDSDGQEFTVSFVSSAESVEVRPKKKGSKGKENYPKGKIEGGYLPRRPRSDKLNRCEFSKKWSGTEEKKSVPSYKCKSLSGGGSRPLRRLSKRFQPTARRSMYQPVHNVVISQSEPVKNKTKIKFNTFSEKDIAPGDLAGTRKRFWRSPSKGIGLRSSAKHLDRPRESILHRSRRNKRSTSKTKPRKYPLPDMGTYLINLKLLNQLEQEIKKANLSKAIWKKVSTLKSKYENHTKSFLRELEANTVNFREEAPLVIHKKAIDLVKKDVEAFLRRKEIKYRQWLHCTLNGHIRDRKIQAARTQKLLNDIKREKQAELGDIRSQKEQIANRICDDFEALHKQQLSIESKYTREKKRIQKELIKEEVSFIKDLYCKHLSGLLNSEGNGAKHQVDVMSKEHTKMLRALRKQYYKQLETDVFRR